MPLRVLFVESGTELGGSQLALLNKLRFLDRQALQPVFASLGFGQGDLPDRVEQLGIPTYRLPAGRFRNAGATVAKIRQLVRIIQREQIDVVFSNSGHPLLYARPAACFARKACVWWVHGYLEHDPLKGHLVPFLEQLLQSDHFIANSRYTASVLARVFPHRNPAPVVPCGVDCDEFQPLPAARARVREDLGIPGHEIVVGMFGRLHPFKGQDVFLRAAARLRRQGIRPRLLLVGGTPYNLSPGYAEWLKRYAGELRLTEQVSFLGQRPDVSWLLNACDIVVHASVEPEPWGQVVAEGMSTGRAMIATAAGGPAEMITHGKNGLLTPPGDAECLAKAIARLAGDPQMRSEFALRAREHALRDLDIRKTVRGLETCLLGAKKAA